MTDTHPASSRQRTAMVLVADGSEEIETITPADVLVRAGVSVLLIGVNGLEPTGSRGLPLRADRLIGAMRGSLADALVIPGGDRGARHIAESHAARQLIAHHAQAGRILAAICATPALVLGPMGLLAGKHATGYPSTKSDFPPDAHYLDQPVVQDGTLITSQGPATALDFGLAIARALVGEPAAREAALGMLARSEPQHR
jgi:4-methyl-5(b-hydroxyethyl)-thiazole monophosphate biosynthesis